MQHHKIRFVSDAVMPDGHDFVFVHVGDDHYIFYRESAVSAELLEESWRAYRAHREDAVRQPLRSVS